jgi:hypothetical protein
MNEVSLVEETRSTPRRIIPVTKWSDFHPWPSISGLRYLIFHEHSNGFYKCVLRIGSRVLIDEELYYAWARSHKEES